MRNYYEVHYNAGFQRKSTVTFIVKDGTSTNPYGGHGSRGIKVYAVPFAR